MAQTPKGGFVGGERVTGNNETATNGGDLAADIEQLKADMANLARQLQETGQHSYGAARRVASEGVEQLRERLRANAGDIERQLTDAVREKPVTALAIAAGIGFLFALMTRR